MARFSSVVPTWTPVAVADTTAMTDNGHHTIQGGSSTARAEMREVYLGGQAGASTPTFMVLGRNVVVGVTLTAARSAALDPSTPAGTPPLPYIASTTKPQRSTNLGMLLNLSFNAFGGVVRWVNGPDELISLLGNVTALGELSLNAFTGGTPGLLGSALIYEAI
jgi:hypothetical protein